ncbi:MAG: hypothetical protein F2923_03050 [Actinobacteria bacterium]|uniref:Unannotated protein n=1 Tax=freshwater metagenome TaxID=449393 RepID=A0A6J7S7D5_9ZZZZ|nr:hypothetical protein [Actinomycetota bacterium]MTB27600.1 hypothetical protein [Actinomycetota bacterium]
MWITSDDGFAARQLAASVLTAHPKDALAANSELRKLLPGLATEHYASALDQAQLGHLAIDRYGIDASLLLLTRDGLEQATRPAVAQLRAQALVASGAKIVLDLSAGLGFDVRAFLQADLEVIAIERDPVTAAYLRVNAPGAEVIEGDSLALIDALLSRLAPSDVVFVDPARRSGRRTLDGSRAHPERDPERWSPPWSFVVGLAARNVRVCAKVAPGFSPIHLPAGWSGTWTTVNRDAVEAMLCSWTEGPSRSARMIEDSALQKTVFDFRGGGNSEHRSAPIGAHLYEPDQSLINAQLLDDFCLVDTALQRVDSTSTWLTSDVTIEHPMLRGFEIETQLPNDTKALRKALIALGVGDVTIKCRGMNLSADQLRKELKLPAGTSATIVIATAAGSRVTLLVHHHS